MSPVLVKGKKYLQIDLVKKDSCNGCAFAHDTIRCFTVLGQIKGVCRFIWKPVNIADTLLKL